MKSCMIPLQTYSRRLKACTTTTILNSVVESYQNNDVVNISESKKQLLVVGVGVDRLSGLPDELLIRILSLLPTKDAARTSLSSKRLRAIFPLITTIDIADRPISDPSECHYIFNQFRSFETFVETVLQTHQSPYLTSFRLGVGSDVTTKFPDDCDLCCKPDVESTSIRSWISFPLTRCCGLRELDLRIHVSDPFDDDLELPSEIFTCETLEVLKLDCNLPVPVTPQEVSSMTFRLPMLKVLYLNASHLHLYQEDDGSFVEKLVSSCPSLEDLTVESVLDHVESIVISSPSLRVLTLKINTRDLDNTDLLRIHTPNLEHLHYCSNFALHQSITKMDHLTKAVIDMEHLTDDPDVSCHQMLGFISSLPNVHHLSLLGSCLEDLNVDLVKVQLPIFQNLKYLELGHIRCNYWDKVLVAFLNQSPVLETLVFPQGMIDCSTGSEYVQREQELCRTGLAIIPGCCRFHLKRIVIKNYYGNAREIDLIQFLLKHALVLEELVISQFEGSCPDFPIVDKTELQKTIQSLPRSSATCSIQVQSTSN